MSERTPEFMKSLCPQERPDGAAGFSQTEAYFWMDRAEKLQSIHDDLLNACKAVLKMRIVCPEDAEREVEMCRAAVEKATGDAVLLTLTRRSHYHDELLEALKAVYDSPRVDGSLVLTGPTYKMVVDAIKKAAGRGE